MKYINALALIDGTIRLYYGTGSDANWLYSRAKESLDTVFNTEDFKGETGDIKDEYVFSIIDSVIGCSSSLDDDTAIGVPEYTKFLSSSDRRI